MKHKIKIILANMNNSYPIPKSLLGKENYKKRETYCIPKDRIKAQKNDEILKNLFLLNNIEIIVFSELQSQESNRFKEIFESNGYIFIQPEHRIKGRQLVSAIAIEKKLASRLKIPNYSTSTLLKEKYMKYRNCTIESDIVRITSAYIHPTSNCAERNNVRERALEQLTNDMTEKFVNKKNNKYYFYFGDLNIDFDKIIGYEKVKNNIQQIPAEFNAWKHLNNNSTHYSHKEYKTKIDHFFTNARILDFDVQQRTFETDHHFPIATV